MLTVQYLKSKWMLKKTWWSSLPFPDSATLACILLLQSHFLRVTPASSTSSPSLNILVLLLSALNCFKDEDNVGSYPMAVLECN